MEEAELEKQRRMVTKSSIKRKPFANLTNIVRKPYHTSSFSKPKRPGSSTASDSSVGTTQSGIHGGTDHPNPQRLTPGKVGCSIFESQKTRSNLKVAAQETRSNGKGNQSCLDKTTNDQKEKSVVLQCSSMENIKNKRKATDVPFSAHQMKNAKSNALIPLSTEKIKDKGKENAAHNTNTNMSFIMPPLLKRKDKGKAIDYPPIKKMKNNMVEIRVPFSGVKIKDRGETFMDSNRAKSAQKDKGKAVATPINYRTLEKKDKGNSCPPLLKTTGNRNEADEAEDRFQSNPQTDPPLNKKTKRYSSTKGVKEYALPQDFVEQQRAYFKEIDEFELQVEEV